MTTGARVVGALVALVLLAALVWGSNARIAAHPSADAVLRLAWSARPERIEVCREPGQEELARLPQHMRQARVCEGRTAEYRLQVRVDGRLLADRVVHGGGLRRDRRLYVFDELTIPPGEASIDVRFERIDTAAAFAAAPAAAPPKLSGAPAQVDERTAAVPPRLRLSRRLGFVSREAVLVTYVPEGGELIVVERPQRTHSAVASYSENRGPVAAGSRLLLGDETLNGNSPIRMRASCRRFSNARQDSGTQ